MGDENTVLSASEARHLLRRTGFGAPASEVATILVNNETRGQAVDRLLDFKPKGFKPGGRYFDDAHNKWVKYMIMVKFPLQEKLVLFWHDHFATGYSKVANVKLMGQQNKLLRQNCKGNFKTLMKAMNLDAAMMEWLDTVRNHEEIPNENYARELQELFTLGVKDTAGYFTYTQADIVQIARAFTGWDYDDGGKPYFKGYDHDFTDEYPERGPKVIFQSTGNFGPGGRDFTVNGEGEAEIDTIIDIILEHTDTDGENTVARRLARRLLEYFAHPNPATSVVDAVIATSGFATNWEITPLLRAIFVHDAFYESAAPAPYGAATKKSVKWPIDYVVGTLRLLRMKLKSKYQYVDGGSYNSIISDLTNMGQVLLDPPSVFGWEWETSWISSAALHSRYSFARDVTSARGGGSTAFRPDKLMDLSLTDPGDIIDAVTTILGLTVRDLNGTIVSSDLTTAERDALIDYLTDNGANPSLDLFDYDTRNQKLNGLFALVLQSPAYQLH
jgi:uncharacterized protein (DUF1800 family)